MLFPFLINFATTLFFSVVILFVLKRCFVATLQRYILF
jgi:hypothetical protein